MVHGVQLINTKCILLDNLENADCVTQRSKPLAREDKTEQATEDLRHDGNEI